MATQRNQIDVGAAIGFAWSAYRRRWRLFVSVMAAMLGGWVVLEIVVVATQRLGIVAWALAHIAFLLYFAGLQAGLLRVSAILQAGGDPTLADAFTVFNLGPRFLVSEVLYLAMVVAGLVLLIVPGVVVAARFAFFGFGIASDGAGVLRSLEGSVELTQGATGRLSAALVVLVGFNLLGAALLGLGLLISVPISVLAMSSLYRQLSDAVRN